MQLCFVIELANQPTANNDFLHFLSINYLAIFLYFFQEKNIAQKKKCTYYASKETQITKENHFIAFFDGHEDVFLPNFA